MNHIEDFAKRSGVHKIIVKKYFDEIEKAGIDWQRFDLETIAEEIRDFAQTGGSLEHKEFRKRLGLPPVIEKRAEEKDPKLSQKQKEQLKESIISGAPEIATLIALYDGKEQDYARRFLKEMVLSPTTELRNLLKGDTLKIRSERGWVKEINDVPLKKAIRSIDFIESLADFDLMASQPGDGTVAVYKRKGVVTEPVVVKPIPPKNEYVLPESKEVTEGKPLPGMEFCYRCGRIVKFDKFSRVVNGQTVYYCSEYCFEVPPPRVISKYGTGQTVSEDTIAEIRKKPVR